MDYETYFDKVYGGWIGKCLGGAAGAPVEGIKKVIPYESFREVFRADLPNDDLDLQLLWIKVLEEKGNAITAKDMAQAWDQYCWYPFSEYGIFLKNYERGIMPPYSGSFNNPVFCEGEGCAIRSEIWAMIHPGDAEKAVYFAGMDGSLDHAGEGVWIEQYYAAVETEAFVNGDIPGLLRDKMHVLPETSRAYGCVQDVLSWCEQYDYNWEKCRQSLMRRYAHFDFTNAVTNLGIVVLALLCGGDDLEKVINTAFWCGFDTDCTCATAGAIWGISYGAKCIPEDLKRLVSDTYVVGIDIGYKEGSIRTLAEDTCRLGMRLKKEEKGCVSEYTWDIKYLDRPAVGIGDTCRIGMQIKGTAGLKERREGEVRITELPEGWIVEPECFPVVLESEREVTAKLTVRTDKKLDRLENTNILKGEIFGDSFQFGIAGALEWTGIGPFFEALDKEDMPGIPSAHGGDCILPTLECMVNNYVDLEKEYIDEADFEKAFSKEETCVVHGYEDLLPLDEAFGFRGQGCIYLKQELYVPDDREIWFVIGNNDGFKIWINQELSMERDEIRLWTPYNNYQAFSLKKGKNTIVIKLLKRTESMKFSIGYRKCEGEHFHRKRWMTDLACAGK